MWINKWWRKTSATWRVCIYIRCDLLKRKLNIEPVAFFILFL